MISGPIGTPLHVTVYDAAGFAVSPGSISWTGLPDGVTATADSTGFNFESNIVVGFNAIAHYGVAEGQTIINFIAPPLTFKSP